MSAPQAMNNEQGGGGSALGNGVLVTGSTRNREQETVPQPSTRKVSLGDEATMNWGMSNTKSRIIGRGGGRSALSEGELQKVG